MIRDAVTILKDFFRRFTKGMKVPVFDRSLPAPDVLEREAKKYR